MTILDTNVVSALMRRFPDPVVVAWLDHQPRPSIWTTSITSLEIQYGLKILPPGRRRTGLLRAFETMMTSTIEDRIAAFDQDAAARAGDLMAVRHRAGRPGDLRDTLIAGIVLSRRATLATGNVRHFADLDVPVVNPWESSSRP